MKSWLESLLIALSMYSAIPVKCLNWTEKNLRNAMVFFPLARQGLASVATILLNVAAGAYGDAAIAGMSIVTRISMFINAFLIGFGQGFQPVCGFNYGAGLYARVRQGFWFCVKVGFFFLLVWK